MGSWDATCGISNLPIQHGDKVVVQLIHRNRHLDIDRPTQSMCHSTHFWMPMGFSFRAEYNDYGWVEEIEEDDFSAWNLDYLKSIIVEREVGENEFHDHEVKIDKLDYETLGEWFHGDRVQIGKALPVSFILFHAAIYDNFSNEIRFPCYMGHDKHPDVYNYTGGFEYIKDNVLTSLSKSNNGSANYRSLSKFLSSHPEKSDQFIDRVARMTMFNIAMNGLGKLYSPCMGQGQGGDTVYHEILIKSMIAHIEKITEEEMEE